MLKKQQNEKDMELAVNIECQGDDYLKFDADELESMTCAEKIKRCELAIERYKTSTELMLMVEKSE